MKKRINSWFLLSKGSRLYRICFLDQILYHIQPHDPSNFASNILSNKNLFCIHNPNGCVQSCVTSTCCFTSLHCRRRYAFYSNLRTKATACSCTLRLINFCRFLLYLQNITGFLLYQIHGKFFILLICVFFKK